MLGSSGPFALVTIFSVALSYKVVGDPELIKNQEIWDPYQVSWYESHGRFGNRVNPWYQSPYNNPSLQRNQQVHAPNEANVPPGGTSHQGQSLSVSNEPISSNATSVLTMQSYSTNNSSSLISTGTQIATLDTAVVLPPFPTANTTVSSSLHTMPTALPPIANDFKDLPIYPTYAQFCDAVDAYSVTSLGGHPPKPSLLTYQWYMAIVGRNMSISEQAMFLANVIWETAGLQFREELACMAGNCVYGRYYGRGYIQLTWDYNYRDASFAIFGDDRLLRTPDLAAQIDIGWKTALFYWRRHVTPRLEEHNAVERFLFGYTVMAINGAIECRPDSRETERLKIYNAILRLWRLRDNSPGRMTGCHFEGAYNVFLQATPLIESSTISQTETVTPMGMRLIF